MSGYIRQIQSSDGEPITAPTTIGTSVSSWEVFANDAAYEVVHGSGTQGDCYFNSTELLLRAHNGTEWVYLQNGINALEDSASTGSSQDLDSTYHNLLKLTNAGLTSVRSLDPGQTLVVYLVNDVGGDVLLLHDDAGATAANRLLLPGGENFTLEDGNTAHFVYDSLASRFRYTNAAGSGGGGTGTGFKNYVLSPDSSSNVTDVGGSVSSDTTTLADLPEETKGVGVLVTQTAGSIGDTATFETLPIDEGDGGFNGSPEMYWKTKAGYVDGDASIRWINTDTSEVLHTRVINEGSSRISLDNATVILTAGENIKPQIYFNVTSSSGLVVSGAATIPETRITGAVITKWEDAGIVAVDIEGFGTVTDIEIERKQVGSDIYLRGKFRSGTPAASEARIGLGGYTIKQSQTTTMIVGSAGRDASNVQINLPLLATDGDNYLNIGLARHDTSSNITAPTDGNTLIGGSEFLKFDAGPIQVAELDGTVTFATEAQSQNAFLTADGHASTALSTNAAIPTIIKYLNVDADDGVDFNTSTGEITFDFTGKVVINAAYEAVPPSVAGLSFIFIGNDTTTNSQAKGIGANNTGGTEVSVSKGFRVTPSTSLYVKGYTNLASVNVGTSTDINILSITRKSDKSSAGTGFPTSNNATENQEFLVTDYRETTLDLTGGTSDFTTGNARAVRIGKTVTVTGLETWEHLSSVQGESGDRVLPLGYRPTNDIYQCFFIGSALWCRIRINSNGEIITTYFNASSSTARTDTAAPPTISYVIT